MNNKDKEIDVDSKIATSFISHQTFLKKFVTRFFSNKEDVEDVVQETFLRAYVAEQKAEIAEHMKKHRKRGGKWRHGKGHDERSDG